MLAIGLQGSPRQKGNTQRLLSMFMSALAGHGAATQTLEVARMRIEPCRELTVCEKKGVCPIDDDMGRRVYGLLREADIIVAASPVFFYNVSAQLKALIDRCQTLWARRYRLNLQDPGSRTRRGFLLGVGATGGKQLFDGVHLTAKYFFDGVSASYSGSLTYRHIEKRGDIDAHISVADDVRQAAAALVSGLEGRPKLLFVGSEKYGFFKMAEAFTRFYAGDRFDVAGAARFLTTGAPGAPDALMTTAMREKGIDMAFGKNQTLENYLAANRPRKLIFVGRDESRPELPDGDYDYWEIPEFAEHRLETMRAARDTIDRRVRAFLDL